MLLLRLMCTLINQWWQLLVMIIHGDSGQSPGLVHNYVVVVLFLLLSSLMPCFYMITTVICIAMCIIITTIYFSGELLMSGEGHTDWLSAVKFNPEGTFLATSSGDGSVKLWDLKKTSCIQTLSDHQQPVWGLAWHWAGSILASAAMDHTIRLWEPFL